jgi:hypothetical protein
MNTALDLYTRINDPIAGITQIGEMFASSGMFGCTRKEQGQILALACMSEGKSPFDIKRTYHLMNGELSMRADAMLAHFRQKAGGKHKVIARDETKASVELTLEGKSQTFTFSWADAEKEPFVLDKNGKVKKNYATPRARMQMLWARVISDGVHTMAPEIVSGVYTPEEIDEMQSASAVTEKQVFSAEKKPAVQATATISEQPSKPAENPVTATAQQTIEVSASVEKMEEPKKVEPFKAEAKDGKLTAETVSALESAITEAHAAKAIEYLTRKGKITKSLFDLGASPQLIAWAQRILDNPEGFLKNIGAITA